MSLENFNCFNVGIYKKLVLIICKMFLANSKIWNLLEKLFLNVEFFFKGCFKNSSEKLSF